MSLNPEELDHRTYLGDGLYVGTDGYHIWLYTSDGIDITNAVALERSVLLEFKAWLEKLNGT